MYESINIIGLLLAICLAFVHVFMSRTQWLKVIPQRWWKSLAGGVSITYVFLDIFPELGEAQMAYVKSGGPLVNYSENHVYVLALLGLAIFYGLEKLAVRSHRHHQQTEGKDHTQANVFWLHIGAFGLYNAVLGYLLHESEDSGLVACLLLFLALALHFMVNDAALREHHKHSYDRVGRWILAAAIIAGWAVGQTLLLNTVAIASIWSLVAGGIILNVLKEELPEKQASHFGMFATGAAIYASVLLAG